MRWQRLTVRAVWSGVLIGLLAAGGISRHCAAASISYADQSAGGLAFTNIMESSGTDPVPLFGPPTAFVTGLDFNPTSFVSTAGNGNLDITDGQLNFTVMSDAAGKIATILLSELGDYSLTGAGTSATQALAGVIIQAKVTQINGANVAPFNLAPVNASVAFNLAANPGIVQPWSLGATLNVAAQVAAQFGVNARATKVEVAINNQLQSLSQTGTQSFIAKKDFRVTIDREVIPEPTSVALLLGGCLGLAFASRRSIR